MKACDLLCDINAIKRNKKYVCASRDYSILDERYANLSLMTIEAI